MPIGYTRPPPPVADGVVVGDDSLWVAFGSAGTRSRLEEDPGVVTGAAGALSDTTCGVVGVGVLVLLLSLLGSDDASWWALLVCTSPSPFEVLWFIELEGSVTATVAVFGSAVDE